MATSKSHEFDSKTVTLARYAKALSHPARIAILETLAERASCICGEIVEVLPLAQSTVSQHLKELQSAGLITGEIEGVTSCYCLNPKAIKDIETLFPTLLKKLKRGTPKKQCC
ncbi:MAG: winged helix-turn-helix transcriptional regulator [Bdellovibrionales bacterium]|nr:winged helix-turn-helix transcriptional regulator [Bdellovibrionales bacterium]